MKRIILLVVLALLLIAPSPIERIGTKPSGGFTDMPNPAAVYCLESHYKYIIVEDALGSEYGICKHGHLICDEWAFYYGTCSLKLGRINGIR